MRLLKYISIPKIINLIKVYCSYTLSILFKKVIVWGNPFSLTTEPTNKCNLQCIECPTGNKSSTIEKGEMSLENYKYIIDEVKHSILFQMIYFQGEPFLNSNLFEMIKYSDQSNIYTRISTNGHFLSKENCNKIIQSGLKEIIISLDGITQESYQKYRKGGSLNIVVEGIKKLVQTKKEFSSNYPKVIIQFIVFSHNEHEIQELKAFFNRLAIDKLELKTAQIYNKNNFNLIPKTKKYSRYSLESHNPLIKSKLKNRCFRVWSTVVITWDATLIPCCFDKNNEHHIGNILLTKVFKQWDSRAFKSFRKKILTKRQKIDICQNCTEGLKLY